MGMDRWEAVEVVVGEREDSGVRRKEYLRRRERFEELLILMG